MCGAGLGGCCYGKRPTALCVGDDQLKLPKSPSLETCAGGQPREQLPGVPVGVGLSCGWVLQAGLMQLIRGHEKSSVLMIKFIGAPRKNKLATARREGSKPPVFCFHGKRGRTNGQIQIAIFGRNTGCHLPLQTFRGHGDSAMPSEIEKNAPPWRF